MKKLHLKIQLLAIVGAILLLGSCNETPLGGDFLEKPQSSDVTIDTIFSTKLKAETFLWETYNTNMPNGFPYNWDTYAGGMYASMVMAACDEGDVYDGWPGSNNVNAGSWGTSFNPEDDFGRHYKGIRNANIFIENVDRVPDATSQEKARMKAEAQFLRSLQYFELMKRYGGVPLVDHVLTASGDVKIPRSTFSETVDFIVAYADSAAALLPNEYEDRYKGRITKGAALALKGRTLLYAASPLFNTDDPYVSASGDTRKLIGYPSYDKNRWKVAADANKAVLDWAAGSGWAKLVDEDPNPAVNYEKAVTDADNSEMLLVNQSNGWWGAWWPMFQQFVMPRGMYGGWYGMGVTLNFAEKYYKADGTDQVWNDSGTGDEFLQKMGEMEPRFQASVFYSGAKWNDEYGVVQFYKKSDGSNSPHYPLNGVGYMKKFLTRLGWSGGQINWPVFRLAEFYLNYAEALNEYSPMDQKAYDALNVIRRRAGLPDITSSDSRYNTQDKLRQAIHRERAVELAFEAHRIFDVRRWRIAGNEGVMKGQMWGLPLHQLDDGSLMYDKKVFESRAWEDKMYLYPIPQGEIDKGYITQNPGW